MKVSTKGAHLLHHLPKVTLVDRPAFLDPALEQGDDGAPGVPAGGDPIVEAVVPTLGQRRQLLRGLEYTRRRHKLGAEPPLAQEHGSSAVADPADELHHWRLPSTGSLTARGGLNPPQYGYCHMYLP